MLLTRPACLAALLLATTAGGAFAQAVTDPYYDFLIARYLEDEGDNAGALAAGSYWKSDAVALSMSRARPARSPNACKRGARSSPAIRAVSFISSR